MRRETERPPGELSHAEAALKLIYNIAAAVNTDRLHGVRPATAAADVRLEVELKPVEPGVVDRSTRQAELAAHQPGLRQVEGGDGGTH